jgi:Superfamily II DNA and RNA helicases
MPVNKKSTGAPKKARWTTEQRAAKGKAPARPRGGTAPKPQRERFEASGQRRDAVERGQSTRPNWEPREKSSGSRFERSAPRSGDRFERSERPARGGYEDRDAAPRYDRSERPSREGYDRGASRDGRGYAPRDDRPRYERSERPARDGYAPRAERPRYERDDRPRGDRFERSERPRFDRDERPARRFEDDRPRRFDRDDRAPRRDRDGYQPRERFDRERDRDRDRDQRTEKPAFVDDVVLERLEAQAIDATDVEGTGFAELGLGQNIVRALRELGAESPFPIQAATIPSVLDGRDVLGRGRTGSGKTIAFGAPLVERLLQAQKGSTERRKPGRAPRALILAPTRELALQIDRTVQPLAQSVGLFTTQIYGGVPYARQTGAISRGVDIVIGTPGRIGDLVSQGRLDLSQVMVTVLDEADHMCELGFLEPVRELLQRTSEGGQKLLYSATLDKGVATLVDEFLVDPAVYEISGEDQASGDIRHVAFLIDQRDKQDVLAELASGPGKKLVFARTRSFAEELADMLDDAGVRAESIHGDLTQSRRTRALEKFTSGRVKALVATDVAARGIHVDDVELVIQADAPDEYKSYLHRSGRTGRAGKSGTVVTLVPRNRRRRTEDLFARAEITPEWIQVRPGDSVIGDFAV